MKFTGLLLVFACLGAARALGGPTGKVVDLLEDLKVKINREGEEEALTYNKFACFCKDNIAALTARLDSESEQKDRFQASINEQTSLRDNDDATISTKTQAISTTQAEISELDSNHQNQTMQYNQEEMELSSAIASLESAIQMLKATRSSVSLVQAQPMAKGIRKALLMGQALTSQKDDKIVTALLKVSQDPNDLTDTYQFHSDDIIDTLQNLKRDFRDQKSSLQATWLETKQQYEREKQDKAQLVQVENSALERTQASRASEIATIQTYAQDYSAISAELTSDTNYLNELRSQCNEKAVLYDERTTTRANEITALSSAVSILSAVEAPAAASAAAFVQRVPTTLLQVSVQKHEPVKSASPVSKMDLSRRSRIVALLKASAGKLDSAALLKVAQQASSDPMAKVKAVVQELIDNLVQKIQDDSSHETWCNAQFASVKETRDFKEGQIKEANSKLEITDARRNELALTLQQLDTDIASLTSTQNETAILRSAESAENAASLQEATAARDAVVQALAVIRGFYRGVALNQGKKQQPSSNIPDAGFSGSYTGAQDDANGIVAMLDVLRGSFEKSIADSTKNEQVAGLEFTEFSSKTQTSLADKHAAKDSFEASKRAADAEDEDLRQQLEEYKTTLQNTLDELAVLEKDCPGNRMTAAERAAKRQEEMDSLKKVLCILDAHAEGTIQAC